VSAVISWWLAIQFLGFAALPVTLLLFRRLSDRGIFFSRAIGLLVPCYVIWLLGSLHLAPYGRWSLPLVALLLFIVGVGVSNRLGRPWTVELRSLWSHLGAQLVVGEAAFTLSYLAWCWVRSYTPDIVGTEKFMDFAFINSINRGSYFPPLDPWLSGSTINYYYFGHLMMAALTRLSGVSPTVGFNLTIPMIAGLVASEVFALTAHLVRVEHGTPHRALPGASDSVSTRAIVAGLASAAACTVLGNLDGAGQMLGAPSTWRAFNWWNPSRVISHTINEFPMFSFLLADVHAHVMAVPFGLLVVAISFEVAITPAQELLWWTRTPRVPVAVHEDEAAVVPVTGHVGVRRPVAIGIVATRPVLPALPSWADRRLFLFWSAALALGSLYFLNGWDYPPYAVVLVLPILVRAFLLREANERLEKVPALVWCAALAACSLLCVAPFLLSFRAPTAGVGVVRDRTAVGAFLTVYGLFAAAVGPWLIATLDARYGVQRKYAVLLGCAVLFLATLFATARLDVLFFVLLTGGLALHVLSREHPGGGSRMAAGLVAVVCLLLAAAEIVYLRDAFQGSPEYRMNTVFKFGYVAWLLLSVVWGFACFKVYALLNKDLRLLWVGTIGLLVAASLVYPVLGAYSKSGQFMSQVGLDGLAYMKLRAPGDERAIRWLQAQPGQPVIMEAVGGEYSEFARVSTNTGLPSVLGWEGHEGQWGHTTGTRAADIATIYGTSDVALARNLLQKYHVRYVFIGSQERAKFPNGLEKFAQLGTVAFEQAGTVIYDVSGS